MPSPKITLSVSDINTILNKMVEADNKTFKIGAAPEITVDDIIFKESSLHGKKPKLVMSYLNGGGEAGILAILALAFFGCKNNIGTETNLHAKFGSFDTERAAENAE